MITVHWAIFEEYRGMLEGLDVLIDWLEENDPAQLEVGSHPILGDKVFANVMAPTTRPEAEAHYETHQRYHDLQIDIEGREAFKVATGSLTLVQDFDEKDDYDLVDSRRLDRRRSCRRQVRAVRCRRASHAHARVPGRWRAAGQKDLL